MKDLIREKVLETKRDLVIQEVAKLFETEGFGSLKMQDIAKSIGMSVGALYKLFESKEDLYYAYVANQIDTFFTALQERCSEKEEPRKCLETFIRMKFDIFVQKRKAIEDPVTGDPFFFLKMGTRISETAQPVFEYLAQIFQRLDLSEPLRERDMLKIAYLFSAYTTGYIEYWIEKDGDLDDSPTKVLKQFLEGMVA